MHALLLTEPVARLQHALGDGWLGVAHALSLLGTEWAVLLVFAAAFLLGGRRLLYALMGLVALESAVRGGIAFLVDRPRPIAGEILVHETVIGSPSFPSGHVSTVAAVGTFLWLDGRLRLWIAVAATLIIALGRLYLGAHYVSDVVGAALIAALLAWGWHRYWPHLAARLATPPTRWFHAASLAVLVGVAAHLVAFAGPSPYHWRGPGLAAGLAVALPLEWRRVRYTPRAGERGRAVVLGLGVPVVLLGVELAFVEDTYPLAALLTFVSTVWAFLAVPAMVMRGRGRRA